METVARRRWKPLAILAAAIGLYWLALFIATHLPFSTTPKGDPYSLDKLQHLSAFGVFAILLCTAGAFTKIPRPLLYLGIIGLIATYAALDEYSQRFVPERNPDFFDWLADVVGVCLGVIAFTVFQKISPPRQSSEPSSSQ